jgi:hypothetical protein
VLAVDSKVDDAYGPETVTLLAKFTKMLSAVLKSSTEKYDLMSESGVLKTEMRFRAKAFGESEIPNIGNALAEEVSALVPWDALTLILFDSTQNNGSSQTSGPGITIVMWLQSNSSIFIRA